MAFAYAPRRITNALQDDFSPCVDGLVHIMYLSSQVTIGML